VLGSAFGLIALFVPGATMLSLVLLFSAYVLVDGLFAIIAAACRAPGRAVRISGVWGHRKHRDRVAAIWPDLTLIAFVLMISAWALLSGALMLAAAFRLKQDHSRGWLAFGGVVSIYGADCSSSRCLSGR
jgi:uncharacterized membrane protein HdeD (DUF308 family)